MIAFSLANFFPLVIGIYIGFMGYQGTKIVFKKRKIVSQLEAIVGVGKMIAGSIIVAAFMVCLTIAIH